MSRANQFSNTLSCIRVQSSKISKHELNKELSVLSARTSAPWLLMQFASWSNLQPLTRSAPLAPKRANRRCSTDPWVLSYIAAQLVTDKKKLCSPFVRAVICVALTEAAPELLSAVLILLGRIKLEEVVITAPQRQRRKLAYNEKYKATMSFLVPWRVYSKTSANEKKT